MWQFLIGVAVGMVLMLIVIEIAMSRQSRGRRTLDASAAWDRTEARERLGRGERRRADVSRFYRTGDDDGRRIEVVGPVRIGFCTCGENRANCPIHWYVK